MAVHDLGPPQGGGFVGPPQAGGGGGALGGIGSAVGGFFGGPIGSALGQFGGQLLSGLFANDAISGAQDQIQGNIDFNPFQGNIQGAGSFGPGGFQLDPRLQQSAGGLAGSIPGLLQGQFANDPSLQQALGQGGGIAGANQNANNLLNQQQNPFFNQANFASNMANINGLGGLFSNRLGQGRQDLSGGAQQQLFGQGLQNLQGASNQQGLVQQNLDASNAFARQGEEDIINQFKNSEFSATRGATTGAANRQFNTQSALLQAQNQRVMNAQQLGQGSQALQQQLGLGQIGAGNQLLGQNIGGFGQEGQFAGMFNQLGLQGEGQGFQQQLQALGGNQSAGQQRLSNALGLFNTQTGAFNDAFGLGLGGIGQQLGIGQLGIGGQTGILNAEANRIGATGMSNQALAGLAQSQGGILGGLF